MKKSITGILFASLILLSAFNVIANTTWQIADGYTIKFAGKDVEGVFTKISGDISFDEQDLASSRFMVSIDVASINTGNGMKNRHAKSEKWFNAEKYPTINFTSRKCSKTPNGYAVEGILEMHGVKNTVYIPFNFSNNTFTGSFSVNRMDYGVGSMEGMSKKVSDQIKLDISIPVNAQ